VLEIETRHKDVKGASIALEQRITRSGELLIEAQVRVAFVVGGRACPIPKALRLAMLADQDAGT
jgi:acyl-CoA thioester hydrolase